MIIFLYGPDSYGRNEKFKELIAPYSQKYKQADILTVDLEEEEDGLVKAKDFLEQPSLFANAKVLVVKEISATNEKSEKEAAKILKSQIETKDTFVFVLNSKPPKKIFSFLLEDSYKIYYFDELKDRALEVFLKTEAKKKDIVFGIEAFDFFRMYINSLPEKNWQAVHELEKLKLLTGQKEVTIEDVKKIAVFFEQSAVYSLARDVLFARELKHRLEFLEKLLFSADAAYAFNSLAYQANGNNLEKLAEYDIAVKSGKLEYEEALLEFVLRSNRE